MFGNVDKFCLNVGWSPAGRLFRLRQVEKNSIVGDERDWIILNCFQHFFSLQCYLLSIVIVGDEGDRIILNIVQRSFPF